MAAAIGGAVSGFGKIKEGKAMMRAGQQGIDNFQWDDITNPYKEMTASTVGADIQREESARGTATAVNALRSAGVRGVVGGMGQVQQAANKVNQGIAADVDKATKDIQMKAAGQDVNNAAIQERRQQEELAGYGKQLDVGMDMKGQGMGDLVAAAGAVDSFAMSAMTGGMGGGKGLLGAMGTGGSPPPNFMGELNKVGTGL